jgi:GNAT superfamily N-acetyltransferase
MKMRMFNEGEDLPAFLSLFQASFDETLSKDYFEWKYVRNPFRIGEIPIIIAEENGRIVGARPFLATRMSVNGEVLNALQPCDAMVHPEFQGKGIFGQLNKYAIEKFQASDYKIFYNFPNKNSFPGNVKSGWHIICETNWHWRILSPARIFESVVENSLLRRLGVLMSPILWLVFRVPKSRDRGITVETVDDIGILEQVFNAWRNQQCIFAVRDRKYLEWRFKSRPERQYQFLVARVEGEARGYFVLSTEDFRGMKRGTIVDYLVIGNDPSTFRSLLIYSLNHLKDQGCHISDTWAFTQKWAEEIVARSGFISSRSILIRRWFAKSNQAFVARAIDKDHFPYDLQQMKWYITPSDSDVF